MAAGLCGREATTGRLCAEKDPSIEKVSTNSFLMAEGGKLGSRHCISAGNLIGVLAVTLIGFCLGLFWVLRDCLPSNVLRQDDIPSITTDSSPLGLVKYAAPAPAATSSVLEVFQVYQPVLTPSGVTGETTSSDGSENTTTIAPAASSSPCEVLLMQHTFAYSYGQPFVGNYTPPSCKFNRVTMNFTVTVQGRQYDRLALMYFGDTEVWRTSTAEPTTNGIEWTYIKDMTEFMYLWSSPQKIIFDLGNLVNDEYTGAFNTTLIATFFTSQVTVEPASLIIPISARKGASNSGSVFTLPSDNATNTISFPRNVNRAVFSVSACGQAAEEFWWSNVLQSNIDTFEPVDGTLYGYSPFREVQVLIDGQLAGVQWPFPVIFTGGVVPGFWRPIVGIDAFDLREHEIDITPWLPILCDGTEHTFEIRVVGIIDDGESTGMLSETVGSSWYVTGKIFIWLDDDAASITTGRKVGGSLRPPTISLSQKLGQDSTGANETLEYTANVERDIIISSVVTSQKGTFLSVWTQTLSTTNYGLYTDYGAVQQNNQTTNGLDVSTGSTYYKSSYTYPLYCNSSINVQPNGDFSISGNIIRGLDLSILGASIFPTGLSPFSALPPNTPPLPSFSGSQLSTTQNGSAFYFANASSGSSSGFGSTSQEFNFVGLATTDTELYHREVEAVNQTIVRDYEMLLGEEMASFGVPGDLIPEIQIIAGVTSPKQAVGRGPGMVKQVLIQGGGGGGV